MFEFTGFDPVAFRLGPLSVRWYGLMYLLGFVAAWLLARVRSKRPGSPVALNQVDDLIFYAAIGVIVGGRVGYMLFYNLPALIDDPLSLFKVWQGGMSFHGGLLGVLTAIGLFAHRLKRRYFEIGDFVAPLVPLGLGFGRIGNFINGELWGRAADPSLPWAMVFPQSGSDVPRHPSQLYQFALEGLLLFVLLWLYARRPRATGQVSGAFLIGYGTLRFAAEFFREPDRFLGLLALNMSMGQWLSVPMIAIGIAMWWWASRQAAPSR